MIFGFLRIDPDARNPARSGGFPAPPAEAADDYRDGPIALCCGPAAAGNGHPAAEIGRGRSTAAAFTGVLFNARELGDSRGTKGAPEPGGTGSVSGLILSLYEEHGADFIERLNGQFALAVWDGRRRLLLVARDHLGIEPLYYCQENGAVIFSSRIAPILGCRRAPGELDLQVLGKYLLFNYNPGTETIYKGIRKLRPAHVLVAENGRTDIRRYWKLSFRSRPALSEGDAAEMIRSELEKAVAVRINGGKSLGVFLSGGLDSSSVTALSARSGAPPIKAFSYRCRGASFDEFRYARCMAEDAGAEHILVECGAEDVLSLPKIVREMNEPFDDAAINVATFLLGREAGKRVTCVLTGDGGDELFGGHPVYEADRIAHVFDAMPAAIKIPFIRLFSRLPDSDKKKNLTVKVKRFFENVALPDELLSHRWRIYYRSHEMRELLCPSLIEDLRWDDLFSDILAFNREADGPDSLSRSLYSDYQTAVEFYLRRNDLNRRFGIETRFPMLDRSVVELCAGIPSRLKIRGWFDTKYILRKAMEGILPETIVHRKDKLGHSIPLKNWIRNDPRVLEFIHSLIGPDSIRRRGLFNPFYVERLIEDHLAMKRNNSHRLWSLSVLEAWLRENDGRQASEAGRRPWTEAGP